MPLSIIVFQVISNSFCGLDVDKLDYLVRDGAALGTAGLHKSDLERIILTATVAKVRMPDEDGNGHHPEYHVIWRDVTIPSIRNVFLLRHSLHLIAYQHKVTVCVQLMFKDAMTTDYMKEKFAEVSFIFCSIDLQARKVRTLAGLQVHVCQSYYRTSLYTACKAY